MVHHCEYIYIYNVHLYREKEVLLHCVYICIYIYVDMYLQLLQPTEGACPDQNTLTSSMGSWRTLLNFSWPVSWRIIPWQPWLWFRRHKRSEKQLPLRTARIIFLPSDNRRAQLLIKVTSQSPGQQDCSKRTNEKQEALYIYNKHRYVYNIVYIK